MAQTFPHILTCSDVREHDLATAAADRAYFRALVHHLTTIATAHGGAAKVLHVFARMIRDQSPWIEGLLRLEISGDEKATTVEVLSESAGLKERLFPAFKFNVPLAEFAGIVQKTPHLIAPLKAQPNIGKRISLVGTYLDEPPIASSPRISKSSMGSPGGSVPPPPNSVRLIATGAAGAADGEGMEEAPPTQERLTLPGEPPSRLLREMRGGSAPPTRRAPNDPPSADPETPKLDLKLDDLD